MNVDNSDSAPKNVPAPAPAPTASPPAPASVPAAPAAPTPPPSPADDEQNTDPFYDVPKLQRAIDNHDDSEAQLP